MKLDDMKIEMDDDDDDEESLNGHVTNIKVGIVFYFMRKKTNHEFFVLFFHSYWIRHNNYVLQNLFIIFRILLVLFIIIQKINCSCA